MVDAPTQVPTDLTEPSEPGLARRLERWHEQVGPVPEALTESGLPVKAAYTRLDVPKCTDLDLPGEYPFARGIYRSMYRGRLWTMRLYAGWGTPDDTNARFRFLIERGQTGLSVALDLPTQMGMDSDHALARSEVGKVGVSVDSLADMEQIFDGIPLSEISTSFTINATAPILLAMYQVVGEKQGVDTRELRGTVQNDILKEYLARKTYIYPPEPSLRLAADVIEYAAQTLPKFNPISVCGYHMRQAGCDAVQEIALTLANASVYVSAVRERGIDVDHFGGQFSFNLSTMRDFFEEIAKHRAARRLWAKLMRERHGATDPKACALRLFSGGDGTSLTAAEPFNNVARITLQALAIVLSGAQAVHTISWDEALGIPSEESSLLALRTQQIIAHESGVARCADPLGGSYYIEALTSELADRAEALIDEIDQRGGVVAGIKDGSLELMIADAAYRQQEQIDTGEHVIVGVNKFIEATSESEEPKPFKVGPEVLERQLQALQRVREQRDNEAVAAVLDRLGGAAARRENLMPAIVEAVRAYATVGEISDALAGVFGRHTAAGIV